MTQATIFALASAYGVAGVAVIRISGPQAGQALDALSRGKSRPQPRCTALRKLYDPSTTPPLQLDEAMVIYFAAPDSFTGEDVAELHIHGGYAVIDSVLGTLSRLEYLRLADPGEFTRRAFDNGKIDLTKAEAIGDLIHAETQAQQALALNQLDGALSQRYEAWRDKLARLLAYAEAEIDFPDEDLPDRLIDTMRPQIEELLASFQSLIGQADTAQKLRKGINITLVGSPNAGKSSLLNCLAQEEVAIVTDLAGTTRDVLDVRMNIGGYAVTLSDTAGLRDLLDQEENAHNAIEAEGIKRALKRASESDYRIVVIDAADDIDAAFARHKELIDERSFICLNKIDIAENHDIALNHSHVFKISTVTKDGIESLLSALENALRYDFKQNDDTVLTRARHKEALVDAMHALRRCVSGVGGDELLAEDLRLALRALGRITGRVDVEDLLDIVFKDFCIGK